jgi:hypothetical protein
MHILNPTTSKTNQPVEHGYMDRQPHGVGPWEAKPQHIETKIADHNAYPNNAYN